MIICTHYNSSVVDVKEFSKTEELVLSFLRPNYVFCLPMSFEKPACKPNIESQLTQSTEGMSKRGLETNQRIF